MSYLGVCTLLVKHMAGSLSVHPTGSPDLVELGIKCKSAPTCAVCPPCWTTVLCHACPNF